MHFFGRNQEQEEHFNSIHYNRKENKIYAQSITLFLFCFLFLSYNDDDDDDEFHNKTISDIMMNETKKCNAKQNEEKRKPKTRTTFIHSFIHSIY